MLELPPIHKRRVSMVILSTVQIGMEKRVAAPLQNNITDLQRRATIE
jgi:hypothetical protein